MFWLDDAYCLSRYQILHLLYPEPGDSMLKFQLLPYLFRIQSIIPEWLSWKEAVN